MSIDSAIMTYNAVANNTATTSVRVALKAPETAKTTTDAKLEAAIQRVALILYMRAHMETPPSAVDLGRGLFDVLV